MQAKATQKQVKETQKQAKGKAKGNGALLCVCFVLLVRKENCHMLRFVLYGFAFVCGEGAVTCHGLLCFALLIGEGNCHTLRFALSCFDLFCFARASG